MDLVWLTFRNTSGKAGPLEILSSVWLPSWIVLCRDAVGVDLLPRSRNSPCGAGRISPITKSTFRELLPILPGGIVYIDSSRRWFTTTDFTSRACTPKTGGGFSAGCFVLLVSTCVKQRLRVTRDASIRRTFASRKQLSVIWRSVFVETARYVCGSSHMTCTRSILSGISMSMESGSIDSCLSLWLFKLHISTCGNMWRRRTSSGRERSYYSSVKMCWIISDIIFKAVSL